MVRPLRSTPITGASSLLRTGPPAPATSVLNASQFLLLDALPLAATIVAAVAARAFPRSLRTPQNRFTSPPCRTPPGQSTGTRQTHPGTKKTPRFRCHLNSITTRRQRFTFVRLPVPHLTPHTAPFPHRSPQPVFNRCSMRWFEASPRRATPKGQTFIIHRAPPSKASPTDQPFPAFVAHLFLGTSVPVEFRTFVT